MSRLVVALALITGGLLWAIVRGLEFYGLTPVQIGYDLDQPPLLLCSSASGSCIGPAAGDAPAHSDRAWALGSRRVVPGDRSRGVLASDRSRRLPGAVAVVGGPVGADARRGRRVGHDGVRRRGARHVDPLLWGDILFAAGALELARRRGVYDRPWLDKVLPVAFLSTGALFIVHEQIHSTAGDSWHLVMGALLIVAGILELVRLQRRRAPLVPIALLPLAAFALALIAIPVAAAS